MRKLSIAIDGPAGAGKSSVSKILASRLGYAYLDTGAMYRAVTYEALKKGLTDPAEITAMTKALDMEVKPGMDAMHVIVDGEDVTPFIRTPEVSGHVSEVSAIGGVRTAMVAIQRKQAEKGGIVLDGRVLFDSEQHIDLPPQQRGAGLLFQNYALFPNMTVEQNILCGLKAEKDRAARQVRCAELLRAMQLEPLAKRYPAQLSGGQQQRTALARILAGRPRILMLDEPFSALDSYLREAVESEVGSLLAGFDGTALLVTHNRDEAYRLCSEMVVLDSGRVLRSGHTRDVFADLRSITAARLTGCKNILPCTRLDAHAVRLTGWDVPLQLALPVPEGCTAVGIRAHDFVPCDAGAPNALPVAALSSSENPFDWNLICTAPDGTARLWWKVSKSTLFSPAPVPPHFLCAAPESIMPLTN